MNEADLKALDQLDDWLFENFGYEGAAMLGLGEPGFDRLRPIFSPLISKLKNLKIITIAGTNGKGETAYRLESLLIKKNLRVALWTSPHLVSVVERMRFSGVEVQLEKCLKTFEDCNLKTAGLSYYEFLFYVFLTLAIEESPDVLVLEVGLGGRLDAVNLFDADISVITSIGRDHQAILGNTLSKILVEKLGVTRPNKICISGLESSYLRTKTREYTRINNILWWDAFDHKYLNSNDHYVRRNQVLAETCFMAMENGLQSLYQTDLSQIKNDDLSFPGRREVMTLGKLSFIFIGAHNIDGFRQAIKYWSSQGLPDEVWVSFSNRSRKDLNICTELISKLPKKVKKVFTFFEHTRALDLITLQELVQDSQGSIEFAKDWQQLIKKMDSNVVQTIAVSGSYYFIGSVMRFLLQQGSKRQRIF